MTIQTGLFGTTRQFLPKKEELAKVDVPAKVQMEDATDGPRILGTFEGTAKFKNNSLTTVDVYRRNGSKPVDNENRIKNLLNQDENGSAYNGYLSPATKRNLEQMLQVWLTAIEVNVDLKSQRKRVDESEVLPTFVTLTLPSQQIHGDNDLKEVLLHPFLDWLKQSSEEYYKRGGNRGKQKGFDVKGFFWRAEPQKNGNIHFHVLVDRYIPWDRIREKWN
jgi:hypothetical protein